MSDAQGALTLAGRSRDGADRPGLIERVAAARRAVGARGGGVHQSDLLEDGPSVLEAFLAELRAGPVNEGWMVKIADLSLRAAP